MHISHMMLKISLAIKLFPTDFTSMDMCTSINNVTTSSTIIVYANCIVSFVFADVNEERVKTEKFAYTLLTLV